MDGQQIGGVVGVAGSETRAQINHAALREERNRHIKEDTAIGVISQQGRIKVAGDLICRRLEVSRFKVGARAKVR